MGRQRERIWVHDGINHHRPVFVRQRFGECFANIFWILDADSLRTHRFSNPGEIWILELDAEGHNASLLLLDLDEIQGIVVEDDLNHRNLPFLNDKKATES